MPVLAAGLARGPVLGYEYCCEHPGTSTDLPWVFLPLLPPRRLLTLHFLPFQ
jgi:hypothetical protein